MTYCLGIITSTGLVMAADSRTHSGVDNISTYQKLFDLSVPGERVMILCTSGSLSLTQGVLTCIRRDITAQTSANLHTCSTLYDAACYIGTKIRQLHDQDRKWVKQDGIDFNCRILLGGQIAGDRPELYMIYNQGNFIQATPETPFLQIGEIKYGKPILDCALTYEMPLEMAAKFALLSISSTMQSNLSVGPPINLIMYEANQFAIQHQLQLCSGDTYLFKMNHLWMEHLKQISQHLPDIDWRNYPEQMYTCDRPSY